MSYESHGLSKPYLPAPAAQLTASQVTGGANDAQAITNAAQTITNAAQSSQTLCCSCDNCRAGKPWMSHGNTDDLIERYANLVKELAQVKMLLAQRGLSL